MCENDPQFDIDIIGPWSELKLDILKTYSAVYAQILANQASKGKPLTSYYIDAFAGAGLHRAKERNELIPGSPANALLVQPGFSEYCFIDMDHAKVDHLESLARGRNNVQIYHGDCNPILLDKVLPTIRFDLYRRALCLLDPYGLQLSWDVMKLAGDMRTIEFFLNFPIMDMNRNVLWRNLSEVSEEQKARMDYFWGDRSWEKVAWETESDLFGDPTKTRNEDIVRAFQKKLRKVAGFKFVPDPIPMRNRKKAVVYYLFFASNNATGNKIAKHLFSKAVNSWQPHQR